MAYRGIKLAPSIICMDWLYLKEDIQFISDHAMDYLHFDIADSLFVTQFGLPFYLVRKVMEHVDLPAHYHLMVEEPRRIFENIPQANSLVHVHYEACRNLHRELITLKKAGFRPGLVLNPATPLDSIEYVVEEVDSVIIMTVNPGSAGQDLVPQTLSKVNRLKEWRADLNLSFEIVVDGNVSFNNIPPMVAAGADCLVLGTSSLFHKEMSREESFSKLKTSIDSGLDK